MPTQSSPQADYVICQKKLATESTARKWKWWTDFRLVECTKSNTAIMPPNVPKLGHHNFLIKFQVIRFVFDNKIILLNRLSRELSVLWRDDLYQVDRNVWRTTCPTDRPTPIALYLDWDLVLRLATWIFPISIHHADLSINCVMMLTTSMKTTEPKTTRRRGFSAMIAPRQGDDHGDEKAYSVLDRRLQQIT